MHVHSTFGSAGAGQTRSEPVGREQIHEEAAERDLAVARPIGWGSTALSLASLMLITDSADAQQPPGGLPTVEVTTPPRPRPAPRPRRAAPTPAPVAPAAAPTVQSDATGPGTGYQAPTSGLTRLPTPLINTPQTVNVVTQQVIREQNNTTLTEALRNVAGITFRAGEGGNGGENPYIRGIDSRNDIFRDGVRDTGWYTRDTFSIDRVEVLKGPSSFLFGRGSTGGVINIISKLPLPESFFDGELTATTGPGLRATVDANGKLGQNIWARVAAVGMDDKVAGRSSVEKTVGGIAPSVTGQITDQTRVTLAYIYQYSDGIPDYGVPYLAALPGSSVRLPAPVPRSNFYGILGPLSDVEQTETHIGTVKVEHEFGPDAKVTNTTRYADVHRFLRINQPPSVATTLPTANLATVNGARNRWQLDVQNSLFANQTDFVGKFNTFGLIHTIAAGLEYTSEDRQQLRQNYSGVTPSTVNILNPNPIVTNPGTPAAPGNPTVADGESFAGYVADQLKVNRYLELLAGARWENYKVTAGTAPTFLSRTDEMFSYRLGAVVHPFENTSLYVMYGTSFNPSAEFLTLAAASANLGPEKNNTLEVGAKADVLGGRLSLTGAVFRTVKTNARVPDPLNNTVNILDGEITYDGVDVGVVGRITDAWQITANYVHLNPTITRHTTAALVGKAPIMAPENAFSLWTTYDVTDRFTVGAGAFFVDDQWSNTDNTTLVPSYWRFDAMASYKLTQHATLRLNVYNITDEYYYQAAYTNWAVPGPGRSASASLRVKF